MEGASIHVGDIGTEIRISIRSPNNQPIVLSEVEDIDLIINKPNGEQVIKPAVVLDEIKGTVWYQSTNTSLWTVSGLYSIQVLVKYTNGTRFTSTRVFERVLD